jgi:hypothetical protein
MVIAPLWPGKGWNQIRRQRHGRPIPRFETRDAITLMRNLDGERLQFGIVDLMTGEIEEVS